MIIASINAFIYHSGCISFPSVLSKYGLNEELLADLVSHVQHLKETPIPWQLDRVPDIAFYKELHHFIKKWPETCSTTKSTIGRLYIAIDKNLQLKGCSPSHAYMFVERLMSAKKLSYGKDIEPLGEKDQLQNCTKAMEALTADYNKMKKELERTKENLRHTKCALEDVTNQMNAIQTTAMKQVSNLQTNFNSMMSENLKLIKEIESFQEKNSDLSEALSTVHKELAAVHDSTEKNATLCRTQCDGGTRYSPAIRKLYYCLLAEQISPAKIGSVIKTILKAFFPELDVEQLRLPKERCAGSMRLDELSTISMAHKAASLCQNVQAGKKLHLNTDGTTLQQKKLGGIAMNNMAVSVNELVDGTAESIINDVSKELQKLRETAHALRIPNANQINWTLFSSSTSDSASTQKKINKLIEEKKKADREKFGPESSDPVDFVENFCAMHLGCNLRKAFLNGIKKTEQDKEHTKANREHHSVDTFVHEFCKLFGHCGVPEYACGVLSFPDFLLLMAADLSKEPRLVSYYKVCSNVKLDRQVGSRYFVTAANAAKIVYLKEAALEFLKYTGKDNGNKLEREVYRKLEESSELIQLKADALMFFHVYADLVMLSKSKKLNKSAMDMNAHYLELQLFLKELSQYPETIMNENYKVFKSEPRLYEDDKDINHRLHTKSQPVHAQLFTPDELNDTVLYPLVAAGAAAMELKLCQYAGSQLPGGIYWNPDSSVKAILEQLSPSNDICESILGLNDYIKQAIPNMHQLAQSTLVQVKKNKVLQWLEEIPDDQQAKVLDLAFECREDVKRKRVKEEEVRSKHRRERMQQDHTRKEAIKYKEQKEKDRLSQLHLITSPRELDEAIIRINDKEQNSSKRKAKIFSLLREQINIRKKLLNQNIQIPFSHYKKQRPVYQIIKELSEFIAATPPCQDYLKDGKDLVGKRITHKFEVELEHSREDRWYDGTIIGYNPINKLYKISYDNEEGHCNFDLEQDFVRGDIRIL